MTRITLDPQTIALLSSAQGEVELCDAAGNLLGWYAPATGKPTLEQVMDSCPCNEEELAKHAEEARKNPEVGRSWQEIKRDLEAT